MLFASVLPCFCANTHFTFVDFCPFTSCPPAPSNQSTTKKKRRFKRSQSCNDAPGPVGSDNDDGDKDFLDEEGGVGGSVGGGSTGGGSGGRGGASLAARGRKFFKRISRSGSLREFFRAAVTSKEVLNIGDHNRAFPRGIFGRRDAW